MSPLPRPGPRSSGLRGARRLRLRILRHHRRHRREPHGDIDALDGHGGSIGAGGDMGFGGQLDHRPIESIEVTPSAATLVLDNGASGKQPFQVIAHYQDKTTGALDATWAATSIAVGSIDGSGLFSAPGAQGGVVTVTATSGALTATATLTVKLHVVLNPAFADVPTQGTLQQSSAPDAAVKWAYPYDGTVFPRGLGAPLLMWMGGGANDLYYIHVTSPTYELEAYTPAPASRFNFYAALWDAFANSTTGGADLKVARLAAGAPPWSSTTTTPSPRPRCVGPSDGRGLLREEQRRGVHQPCLRRGASAPVTP